MYKPSPSAVSQQLSLKVQLCDDTSFTAFSWVNNTLLHEALKDIVSAHPKNHILYLWGGTACGKSHLLQACCQEDSQQSSAYLPLKILADFGPAVLTGIEEKGLICIDDIDAIAAMPQWEEAIFHLYNRIRDNQRGRLIISGTLAPMQMKLHLPDLKSRLSWGLVIQVNPLSDDDKITTLIQQAKRRGLILPSPVAHFLVNRCSRNMHDLYTILNQLDAASLSAKRKLTIPFVKEALAL